MNKEEIKRKQIERAKQIADEVRRGIYQPALQNKMEIFFPTRPLIKKDDERVREIFGDAWGGAKIRPTKPCE